jgi:hypothetical protein
MTSPYGQSPTGPTSTNAPAAVTGTPVLSIITFVLSAIAVLFLPIVFGIAGIVTGVFAVVRKERLGKIALVVAVVATIVGFALGALVMSQTS